MMRDLIGVRGSGGGHGMIAGGRLHALDLDASARAEVYAELVAHLGAQVGAPTTAEPLLPR
jgi:hypothetical protein